MIFSKSHNIYQAKLSVKPSFFIIYIGFYIRIVPNKLKSQFILSQKVTGYFSMPCNYINFLCNHTNQYSCSMIFVSPVSTSVKWNCTRSPFRFWETYAIGEDFPIGHSGSWAQRGYFAPSIWNSCLMAFFASVLRFVFPIDAGNLLRTSKIICSNTNTQQTNTAEKFTPINMSGRVITHNRISYSNILIQKICFTESHTIQRFHDSLCMAWSFIS